MLRWILYLQERVEESMALLRTIGVGSTEWFNVEPVRAGVVGSWSK